MLFSAGKLDHAQVIGRLQQETDPQAVDVGYDLHANFGEVPRFPQSGCALVDFVLGVGRICLLSDDGEKGLQIAVWISNQGHPTDILPFIGLLRRLRCKLRP